MDGEIASGCRRAAAIAYAPRDAKRGLPPRVVAKGESWLADEIIARARAAGVHIHQSRELVALLLQVDLDAHIPPALYVAVAEVLAWIYQIEGRSAPIEAAAEHRLADACSTRPGADWA